MDAKQDYVGDSHQNVHQGYPADVGDSHPNVHQGYPAYVGDSHPNVHQGYPAYVGANQPSVNQSYPAPYGGYTQQQHTNQVIVTQPTYTTAPVTVTTFNDNMGLAIFACLCCFWPLGIAAIVKASEAQGALARNDLTGAASSAKTSRTLSLISIAIGVIWIVVVIIIVIVQVTAASKRTNY